MCELLGISSRYPARISVSFERLARHGGWDGRHEDGWGVAYYDQGAVRLVREPGAAWQSPWVRFLRGQVLESRIAVAHVRHATQGENSLANTQPFARELGGRTHVFIHNGNLDLDGGRALPLGRHRPVGRTDSEHAFCFLLDRLEALWTAAGAVGIPPLEERLGVVRRFADVTAVLGPMNFVYSDGDALFAHGDRRRNPGEIELREPGLFALWRSFVTEAGPFVSEGIELECRGEDDRAVLVASVPLTREAWIPLPRRAVVAFAAGQLAASAPAATGQTATPSQVGLGGWDGSRRV
jgi:glutamine amidotransferase